MKQFITPIEIRTFFKLPSNQLQKLDAYQALLSGKTHISEFCPAIMDEIKNNLISEYLTKDVDFKLINIELVLEANQKETICSVDDDTSFASFIGDIRLTVPSHYTHEHIGYLFENLWSDAVPLIEPKKNDPIVKEVKSRLQLRDKAEHFQYLDVWCWDLVSSRIVDLTR